MTGEPRANDTDGYALAAQSGKSQGRPPKKHGLAAHRQKRPAQLRSPREPLSRSADRKSRPGQNPHKTIFMPRRGTAPARTLGSSQCGSTPAGRGCRPTLSPAALPAAEQSSHAGAVTGVGVTGQPAQRAAAWLVSDNRGHEVGASSGTRAITKGGLALLTAESR